MKTTLLNQGWLRLGWLRLGLICAAMQFAVAAGSSAQVNAQVPAKGPVQDSSSVQASAPAPVQIAFTASAAPVAALTVAKNSTATAPAGASATASPAPRPSWKDGDYISGDWDGLRTSLMRHGISPFVYWTGLSSGNPLGGEHQGHMTAVDDFYMGVSIDPGKFSGWHNATITISGVNRDGRGLTNNYIAPGLPTAYNSQQCVGGQSLFFYELVLKQLLDNGKITLKAGRFSASDDLNASPIYSYYLNNGIDGDIRNILFDTQSSAYPFSTWAGLAKFKPNDKFLFQAGVYQTWDNIFQSYTNGTDWTIHPDDGVIYMEQAAWTPMLFKKSVASQPGGAQTVGLPGHYWLGSTYTPWKGFETFREQLHLYYRPHATPVKVGDSYGFYAHADQMVHQKFPGSTQGLTLWAASAYYPQQSISVVPFQLNAGAIYKGLWQKRPEDRTIFGLIYGKYSRDYAHMIRHENHGNRTKDRWNPRYELVLEGGHRFQLSRFAFFQPDIQWDVRPGGVGSIPNAIAAGAEAGVTF